MNPDVVELELSVAAPSGWVRLNLDEELDADEFALAVLQFLAQARELAGERVDLRRVDLAAQTLSAVVRVARDRLSGRGGLAFAFVGHPEVATAVWLDVLARPEDGFVEWAERRFAVELPAADPHGHRSSVELPSGAAQRVRSVMVPDSVESPVAGTLDLLVRPVDAEGRPIPGRIVLSARWAALAHGDELAGLVDEFARTVQLRLAPSGETSA